MDLIIAQIVVITLLVVFLIFMAWSDRKTRLAREAEDRQKSELENQAQDS